MAEKKPTNTAPKPKPKVKDDGYYSMVEDDRDPRHKAGQNHIDHIVARYDYAAESKKAGKDYDNYDVEAARASGIYTPEEIEKDFPSPSRSPVRKELQFGDEGYGRGVMRTKAAGVVPEEEAKKIGYRYKKGGSVKSSASKRADGIATKGKTKGRMI